jgi:hypothetical protein
MNLRGRLLVPLAAAALTCSAMAAGTVVPATAAPAAAPSCTGAQLHVHLGMSQGAAGTVYHNVRFRNTGAAACTLDGFPRFVHLNAAGSRVGFPAVASGGHHPVTVRPGRSAVAALGIPDYLNFPRVRCHPRRATWLRVTAPGTHTHHRLPLAVTVCTTRLGRSVALAVRHHF